MKKRLQANTATSDVLGIRRLLPLVPTVIFDGELWVGGGGPSINAKLSLCSKRVSSMLTVVQLAVVDKSINCFYMKSLTAISVFLARL